MSRVEQGMNTARSRAGERSAGWFVPDIHGGRSCLSARARPCIVSGCLGAGLGTYIRRRLTEDDVDGVGGGDDAQRDEQWDD